jgi:nucleotide-binding universal stress UspA family protein
MTVSTDPIAETQQAEAPQTIGRIAWATDGSKDAEAAGALIRDLELPAGTLVDVITVTTERDWELSAWLQTTEREWGERVSSRSVEAIRRDGLDIVAEIRDGDAAREIVRAADTFRADLLVVGSRGLSALERFVLGSVADKVAHLSHCPVLIARPPRHQMREVILAIDDSAHAAEAAAFIVRFPLPAGAHITVCNTYPVSHPRPYAGAGGEPFYPDVFEQAMSEVRQSRRSHAEQLVRGVAGRLRAHGYQCSPETREGDPAGEILALAEEREADLIVAGARGVSLLRGLLVGSVAGRLVKAAPCSVLLVHVEPVNEPQQ